jgi:hypothetical protein
MSLLRQFGQSPRARRKRNHITIPQSIPQSISAKYFRTVCHFDEGEITSRFRKAFLQSISAQFVISTKEKSHHDSAMHFRNVCHCSASSSKAHSFDEGELER